MSSSSRTEKSEFLRLMVTLLAIIGVIALIALLQDWTAYRHRDAFPPLPSPRSDDADSQTKEAPKPPRTERSLWRSAPKTPAPAETVQAPAVPVPAPVVPAVKAPEPVVVPAAPAVEVPPAKPVVIAIGPEGMKRVPAPTVEPTPAKPVEAVPAKQPEPVAPVVEAPEPVPAPAAPEVKPAPAPPIPVPAKQPEPVAPVVEAPEPVPAPAALEVKPAPAPPAPVPAKQPEPVAPVVEAPEPVPAPVAAPVKAAPTTAGKCDQYRYHFDPSRRERALVGPHRVPVSPGRVAALYGTAFAVYDDGIDVCSPDYAAAQCMPDVKRPVATDLSNWTEVRVPAGVLAVDPRLGRFQFSSGKSAKLRQVGRCHIGWGEPRDVVVSGRYAYMAIAESSFPVSIYDISNPAMPVKVGMIEGGDMEWPTRVAVCDDLAYIPSRFRSLGVADVSNAASPKRLAKLNITKSTDRGASGARSVIVDGEHAFVTVHDRGVAVLQVPRRNPQWARQVSFIDIQGFNPMSKPRIANGHLFLGNSDKLLIYDVSDPRNPKPVSSTQVACTNLRVRGNHAFVVAGDGSFSVVDISDMTHPSVIGKCQPVRVETDGLDDIALEGDFAFATVRCMAQERVCFFVIDVSTPSQPKQAGQGVVDTTFGKAMAYDDPRRVDPFQHPVRVVLDSNIQCMPTGIDVANKHAYVSDERFGLWVFDVSDPAKPKLVGGAKESGEVSGAEICGNYAYIPQNMKGGLSVVDISSPTSPRWLSYYHTATDAWAAANYANKYTYFTGYAPKGGASMHVLDVSQPRDPKLLLKTRANQDRSACMMGRLLFMDGQIFSLDNPAAPERLAAVPSVGKGWGLRQTAVCNRLYVCRNTELAVIDITNPRKPVKLGGVGLPEPKWWCERIQLVGDKVLVPHGEEGLFLVDVSNERAPKIAAHYPINTFLGGAKSLLGKVLGADQYIKCVIISAAMVGNVVYAVDYWNRIYALDVSDLKAPKVIDQVESYYGYALNISGDYLYRATLDGLTVFDLPRPPEAPTGEVQTIAQLR